MMDIFQLAKKDHFALNEMLRKLMDVSATDEKTRVRELLAIKALWQAHMDAELRFLYPLLRGDERDSKTEQETLHLQDDIKKLLNAMVDIPSSDKTWSSEMVALASKIRHHIVEEESDLFAKIRQRTSLAALDAAGDAWNAARNDGQIRAEPVPA